MSYKRDVIHYFFYFALFQPFLRKLTIFQIWGILSWLATNVIVWKIQMAPFNNTNKSTIISNESNFHPNVVDSNLPRISLTGQDTFIVCNNSIRKQQLKLKFVLF
jgi:hypothetical protein